MLKVILLVALAAVASAAIFEERFEDGWDARWVTSKDASKELGPWKHTAGKWYGDAALDKGIQTGEDARFYAISTKFDSFDNKGKDLVVQFSVKHEQKIDCGGGYLKVLPADADLENFNGDTEYYLMFGPDICGPGTKKVHTIFNYKGDNKLITKDVTAETDQLNHLYTLIVHPDQTYEIKIDGESKQTGKLEDDWDFLAPKEIKDPAISKAADWVDDKMMDDPEDVKPAGYDDIEEMVVDPEAEKPDDWDDELDGEWEAPMIDNPEYKGPWSAAKIENPAYKGPWVHAMVANPEYEHDDSIYHFPAIGGVGIDVWQVKAGSIFDNILITDSVAEAEEHAQKYFLDLKDGEKTMWDEAEQKRKDEDEVARKAAEEAAAAEEEDDDDWEDEDAGHNEL